MLLRVVVSRTAEVQTETFQLAGDKTASLASHSEEINVFVNDAFDDPATRRKSSLHGRSVSVSNLSAASQGNGLPHTASDLAPLTKSMSTVTSPKGHMLAPLKSAATDTKRVQSSDSTGRKVFQENGLDNFIDSFKKISGGFNSTWSKITQGHSKTPEAMRVMREKRNEDQTAQVKKWDTLLPHLDAKKGERYVVEMVYMGVPGSARERIWKKGLGNYLQVTPVLYEAFQSHAQERVTALKEAQLSDEEGVKPTVRAIGNEASLKQIHLDLNRTFPLLEFFRTGGPYHGSLRRLLETYVCYRPDVGYVQGMSFLACMLLLNMDEADAFVCFTNLLNRPLLSAFYQMEPAKSQPYIDAFAYTFRNHLPRLYQHMRSLHVSHHMFIHEWLLTCFSKSCPLDTATRVWDGFTIYGDVFLIRTAVGIMSLYSKQLLTYEFDEVALFMTKLPQDMDPDALIHHIRRVNLTPTRLAALLAMFQVPAK
ncbi:hypothetical protein SARC_07348 [Sphaeroforma arctica JP610]|uniref:Rab-GAP TBC domain-containing protein n=1 Tax=Sphaeroforma arctica JP610 TaxID=667725 RepID=A0A0L0FWF0_9EUKA|nr:hypothetical protein SARC_07348 [Sphaeroforma arctica JP610]KNC80283.1 hypothetical protein SARC_07348 [Sphaeroforma arctica JP610]|eukprot:XP_014154185.1 hypothetical protein SARC_07348 [Sphaeroforma arctica JP610]